MGYEVASVASTVLEIVGVDNSVTDEIIERCDPVDLGATLFHDTGAFLSGRWFASEAMKAGYVLTSPMAAIVDYVIKIFD